METQPIKIALDEEMADIFKQATGEDGNAEAYDLHMGILELSVSLRNINHDVEKSVNFLAKSDTTFNSSQELVFLNDFRMQFKLLQHGKDPEERTLHETRGDLFMRLYKELVDIEPNEIKRCEYLAFFYDLFESVKPKLSGPQESFTYRMELIDRMHGQVQCILERLSRTQNAKEISSASKVNIYLESKIVPNEVDTKSSSRIVGMNEEKCNRDKKVELRKVHTEKLHVEGFSVIESYREIINCPLEGIRFDDVITLVTYKNLRSEPKDPKPSKNDFQMESISPDVHENNFSIASHEDSAYISFMDRVFLSVNDSFACKETISSVEPVEKSIRNLESCSENNFVLVSSVFNEKGTDKNDELPKELKVSKSSLNKDLIFDRRDVENIVPFTIEKDRIGHKISINSEFKLYDSHSCPKTTQPFNYNTTATCSTKSSYKGACKIPIGIHSCNFPLKKSAGTLSGSKFDKPTQSNLEKMKDLFVDYKKKLDSINEVLEKQLPDTENKFKTLSEPEKMEADGKSTLQKKNLKSPTVSTKSEDQSLNQLRQAVSDIKMNILKEVDKSLELTHKNSSHILLSKPSREIAKNEPKNLFRNSRFTDVLRWQYPRNIYPPKDSVNKILQNKSCKSNYSSVSSKKVSSNANPRNKLDKPMSKLYKKRKCNVTEATSVESEFIRKSRPKWHHQRYVIAAPRVIIKSFKSNPAYEWVPDDPNAPDLYEQLDQFFEITGHKKYCAGCETITASIQAKLSQVLQRVIREAPEDVNFPDLITIVGKGKLEQLLTRKEKTVYESLRWQARDKGDQDLSAESLFTDALHGMMGYGSPHLKVSPLTGRLLLCSPQHQKSISESYLLLTVGHLGYFYRELKGHQVMLAEQGDTAVALRKCLQKYLLNFHQFYEAQKRNPCSLLSLYQSTRDFQLQFEWLLEVFNNVQKAKSAVVSLYEESRRRTGYQRNLLLKWLRVVIQPFIFNLYQWLLNGRLPSANLDKFLIEQTKSSKIEEFWQNRYCITEFFSGIFDPQLSEILLSVGKTLKYSDKYLAINVETCLPRKKLRCMLLETFDQFFRHGDQEPLYNFVRKLHLEISCKVLKHLRKIKTSPEHLFSELHKYIMLTDHEFTNEFLKMFEPILSDTESSFNIQLFNEMKDKMLHKPVPDIYIDKSQSEGSRCWSMLILRWKMPVHWKALLGGDSKEYEAIFSAMWRFHYVYYVLCERVHRQQMQFRNRIEFKYFEDLNETFKCFSKLINACMRLMSVLREYFFNHLLEPAFAKLLLACKHANTVDQLLDANRKYLRTIMFGSLQEKNLRKSHQYLERLYDLILKLDDKQQKFLKLSQNSVDYVIKVRAHKPQSIVSNFYRERMLQFRWTCQNYSDVIKEMRDQFDLTMISFLFSLHLAADDSLRRLAKRLDPECYYMDKDNRLGLVQFFEFKRKTQKN
ncbi:uncharacterized protein Dere_GG12569 [Drosophila erecta]|uniref:Gamma tubulin complex component C-terminal domain-containing protein n=1 Tax=Drosophila erecta TaxID=7220 RepID=B3PA70_DROER|nr:uncharacterized protein Dere_GG12569 [Drosophila erecta]